MLAIEPTGTVEAGTYNANAITRENPDPTKVFDKAAHGHYIVNYAMDSLASDAENLLMCYALVSLADDAAGSVMCTLGANTLYATLYKSNDVALNWNGDSAILCYTDNGDSTNAPITDGSSSVKGLCNYLDVDVTSGTTSAVTVGPQAIFNSDGTQFLSLR